jgi:hypothetical protein
MNIHQFAAALIRQIEQSPCGTELFSEADFEKRHIVVPAWKLSRQHPEIRVFTHPWKRQRRCRPTCDSATKDFLHRVEGCPVCWAASKAPTAVEAFGTRSNFDLVAVDGTGRTLAVEAKWLSLEATRGPNSEFQRFIGQCALGAAVNDVVIGVCGFHGQRKKQFGAHEAAVRRQLRKIGVFLIPVRSKAKAPVRRAGG